MRRGLNEECEDYDGDTCDCANHGVNNLNDGAKNNKIMITASLTKKARWWR